MAAGAVAGGDGKEDEGGQGKDKKGKGKGGKGWGVRVRRGRGGVSSFQTTSKWAAHDAGPTMALFPVGFSGCERFGCDDRWIYPLGRQRDPCAEPFSQLPLSTVLPF